PVAPAVRRAADEPGHGDLAVLQFRQGSGIAGAGHQVFESLGVNQFAYLLGNVERVGARRIVSGGSPRLVCSASLALARTEVQRLGARLVAEHLALKMRGDGEDLEAVALGEGDALLGEVGGA